MDEHAESEISENLRTTFSAIVDYHNNLAQMRFTVAGLFLAANGFLASGFFQDDLKIFVKGLIIALALILTIICWIIEVRTRQLLENLASKGIEIEGKFGLQKNQGFFSVLENQGIGQRIFFPKPLRDREYKFWRHVFTHTVGINLIYICIFLFWMLIAVYSFING